ncbi:Dirigent protein [Rhynchospora pubera]|uniref:Dirigent protein n=2 Tax=Rhynchospora pubera TaxID=906938 RepID=A0AAV8HV44_9POAL|nr:Dirigent protein [Rhynchospora pubera]
MASFLTLHSFCLFSILFAVTVTATHCASKEKPMTHFRFYMHDDFTGYTGTKPTAIRVVTMPKLSINDTSPRTFGDVAVLNNLLTKGPSHESEHLGRAQGFSVRVADGGLVNALSLHLVFEHGTFAGSSIFIQGRIPLNEPIRESVLVGGTGQFRFARGYLISENYDYNLVTGGVVEVNVYVM